MATIKLKGPGLNEYFAREMLTRMTPEEARTKVAGPALEALERVLAEQKQSTSLAPRAPTTDR